MAMFSGEVKPAGTSSKDLPPDLQKSIAKVNELSSLPEVTSRIVEVVENPDATAKDIHGVVEKDPALATRILKIVNSAFYGLPSQVASLERAILMLGLSALKNLALATSVTRLIKPGPICDEFQTLDLWKHCVAVAVCSKMIAHQARHPAPDEAFVAGLVHDMGLIVAQQVCPNSMKVVAERCIAEPQDFCALEQEVIGADHQAFGGAVAARWKFPPGLRFAIAYHHEPDGLKPEFQKVTSIVHLADTLCCNLRYGFWLTAFMQDPPDEMLDTVGIKASVFERIAADLPAAVEEANQAFAE